jgi:quinol monooxygenase YgiN
MTFISATRLRIRSIWFLPAFFYYALKSAKQARQAAGNLGMTLLNDANRTFWTCTAWKDESAMRAFMMDTPHRKAMPKLVNWCSDAAVVHWTQESPTLPGWEEVHRWMVAEGRPSRVSNPSPDHVAFRIPNPRVASRR